MTRRDRERRRAPRRVGRAARRLGAPERVDASACWPPRRSCSLFTKVIQPDYGATGSRARDRPSCRSRSRPSPGDRRDLGRDRPLDRLDDGAHERRRGLADEGPERGVRRSPSWSASCCSGSCSAPSTAVSSSSPGCPTSSSRWRCHSSGRAARCSCSTTPAAARPQWLKELASGTARQRVGAQGGGRPARDRRRRSGSRSGGRGWACRSMPSAATGWRRSGAASPSAGRRSSPTRSRACSRRSAACRSRPAPGSGRRSPGRTRCSASPRSSSAASASPAAGAASSARSWPSSSSS